MLPSTGSIPPTQRNNVRNDKQLDIYSTGMVDDSVFGPLGAAKHDTETSDAAGKTALWRLAANWHGEPIRDTARVPSPRRVPAGVVPRLAISSLPHIDTRTNHTSPKKHPLPSSGSASERSAAHSTAASSKTGPSSHSGSVGECSSSNGPTGLRQRASPGALLRMQSATTSPAPHPISELMRLTAPRHVVPMSRVIHSMASLSRAGQERSQRKTNQDAVFAFRQYVESHQAIAGVLDGHGPNGHGVSSFIKRQLPVVVAEQLRRKGEAAAGAALRAAFVEVQAALRAASGAVNARLSGSTAVVSLLQGRRLTTAWVGDSRAVLLRREVGGGWRGIPLTSDHKPTSAGELTRILAAGGRVERLSDGFGREVGPHRVFLPRSWVPGLAMSRALGDFVAQTVGVIAEPEVHSCELESGDEYLVVGSDGIWEFMNAQDVAETVKECENAEDACKAVVDAANERWSQVNEGVVDDISVVIAKLLPPPTTFATMQQKR